MTRPPRYLKCLDYCGEPGAMEMPWPDSTLNWLGESTPDQKRIEDVLEGLIKPDSAILHVGIGNTELARRFGNLYRTMGIDGITLGTREKSYAVYSRWYGDVHLVNKYSPRLLDVLDRAYDFIIDNNLSSYACCVQHFRQMMLSYTGVLKPGGRILTDYIGLAHTPGDPNWNIADDIEEIAAQFGLTAVHETELVISLRKAVPND